jgi:hypothetical protein
MGPGPRLARPEIAARQPLRWKLTCAAMDSAPRFKLTHLFWIGLVLLILGTGPLLAIVLAAELGLLSDPNPNPNPIGPGLLAFFTFWPRLARPGRQPFTPP